MTTTNTKTAPAYATFANALIAQFAHAGVPLVPATDSSPEGFHGPSGWVCFEVVGTGDKVYVNRTRRGNPTIVETTVPFAEIPASLIVKDMRSLNGKVEARVTPDASSLASGLIPVLKARLEGGAKLRASRTPVRATPGAPAIDASAPLPASAPEYSEDEHDGQLRQQAGL